MAAGAASGADLGSEVPNLGVARALFVILLLHLGAIAAIFIHNKATDDEPVVKKSPVKEAPKAAAVAAVPDLPRVQAGEEYYLYYFTSPELGWKIGAVVPVGDVDRQASVVANPVVFWLAA